MNCSQTLPAVPVGKDCAKLEFKPKHPDELSDSAWSNHLTPSGEAASPVVVHTLSSQALPPRAGITMTYVLPIICGPVFCDQSKKTADGPQSHASQEFLVAEQACV